jgi:DNA-directed RNA polymerase subunit RPC12/RpoP
MKRSASRGPLHRESTDNTMYDCVACDKTFASDEALRQHERDSPAHAATYECETCDKTFASDEALRQHERDSLDHTPGDEWSMYPSLHEDVSELLVPDGLLVRFYGVGGFEDCIESYETNIMGQFDCLRRSCAVKRWSSKMIATTIRLYRDKQYNAIVWHQQCRRCKSTGRPILDGTYAERIAYRLKRWFGVEVEVPYYSGQSKGPHQESLCAGCRHGHCRALL